MAKLDIYSIFYDILAYLVAFRSLVDEILYKLGFKRKLDARKELPSDLTGQVALVTGGSRGLGLTVVKTLVSKGCNVFVASSQTPDRFQNIRETVYGGLPEKDLETGVTRGKLYLSHLDLSSMNSVTKFIEEFKDTGSGLNYLICNAGIMFAPKQITEDNFESHLAVNYLGHSLLILELLPILKKTSDSMKMNSRVVSVASSTHKITKFRFEDILGQVNYSSSQAYAQSKLAQIMFSTKLSKVLHEKLLWHNVKTFSLHPGVILSDLYEHVHLIRYFPVLIPLIRLVTRNMVQGSETVLYATLSEELHDVSGVYLEDCGLKSPSNNALNEECQDRLWDLTKGLLAKWLTSSPAEIIKSN